MLCAVALALCPLVTVTPPKARHTVPPRQVSIQDASGFVSVVVHALETSPTWVTVTAPVHPPVSVPDWEYGLPHVGSEIRVVNGDGSEAARFRLGADGRWSVVTPP